MKHFTQKLRWFLMSLMLCAWVGTVWGQSSGPKITYDFSGEEFTVENGAVVNSDKSITMNGAGSANFKFNTGYFMMGKNGAYLTLPTFDFDVEKIVLTGRAAASTSTGMNIYVGEKAVSTATTGCTGTNTYEIASDYQSAGNAYTIKVTSSHNAQITKIEVYEVSSDPGTETDPNAPGTETTPYTVAQARAAIDAGTGVTGVYATGIVSKIVTPYNEKFGNISYNISADGTTEGDQLEAYRGFGKEGAWFTSADDIQVGDEVVIYGNLTKYNSTYEFAEGNQLVSLKRAAQEKKEAGIAYETTEFTITVGDEFTAPTLTNPNGLTVSYAGDNDKLATVDATSGRITLTEGATGVVTVTASFAGNDEYEAGEANYTLTVEEKAEILSVIDLRGKTTPIVFSKPKEGFITETGYANYVDGVITDDNGVSYSGWNATDAMTGNTVGIQLKANSGKLSSPVVLSDHGFTVELTNITNTANIVAGEESSSTGSLTTTSTSTNFVIQSTSKYTKFTTMVITPIDPSTFVSAPTFSVEEGFYSPGLTVELSCTDEGTTIFYTTDGSAPTNSSNEYNGAITINETTTIKAIAYDAEGNKSEVASATYTIFDHTWAIQMLPTYGTKDVEVTTVLTDPVTITFDQASASNPPKYYKSGDAVRIYSKNTLTISAPEGKAITSININCSTENYTKELVPDCGTFSIEGTTGTWTGTAPSVVLTPSAQTRIQSIDVETVDLEEIGTVTVSSAGYATYCNLQPCIVGDGSVTFVVPMAEGSTLEEEAIGTIPAGTGVLVKGEGTYKVYGHEETTVPTDCYVLQNQDGNVAFYKVQEGTVITLGANKAYLDSSIDAGGAVKAFFMGEEADDATGIDTVDASAEKATEIYNLNGQRVSVMTKGIYVVNGKKVLVK